MNQPDFEGVRDYILGRLEKELPGDLFYHALKHTRDEVEPAAARFGKIAGLSQEDLLLVRTAALFHDAGFIERIDDHESVSVRMAEEVLPTYGYCPEQISTIKAMVLATRLPQSPQTLPEKILADADLAVLGSNQFITRCLDLQAELAAHGSPTTNEQWFRIQEEFLSEHRYHTAAARKVCNPQKRQNIQLLRLLRQNLSEKAQI